MRPVNVGIVGCGMIAEKTYFRACGEFSLLNPVACADLEPERAEKGCTAIAENGWGTAVVCSYEKMLANEDIDLVLNLTNPKSHYSLNMRALTAGKHVHSEKPLAVTNEEGKEQLEAARQHNVRLSCAPDTFLGTGHQTARALVDAGAIGEPSAVTLFMVGAGPDGYHEYAEMFFEAGAGPLMDTGVYWLTTAINILGPVARVTAFSKTTFPERTVLHPAREGVKFRPESPTHVTGALEFANGVLGTIIASFDNRGGHHLPDVEIHGTEGSMQVPNPNQFGKSPLVIRHDRRDEGWKEMPATHGCERGIRGLGAAELAAAIGADRPHRASAELAYHVLDVCNAILESAESGQAVAVGSTVERPALMPDGPVSDVLD